jgi:hypothetical protein
LGYGYVEFASVEDAEAVHKLVSNHFFIMHGCPSPVHGAWAEVGTFDAYYYVDFEKADEYTTRLVNLPMHVLVPAAPALLAGLQDGIDMGSERGGPGSATTAMDDGEGGGGGGGGSGAGVRGFTAAEKAAAVNDLPVEVQFAVQWKHMLAMHAAQKAKLTEMIRREQAMMFHKQHTLHNQEMDKLDRLMELKQGVSKLSQMRQ